MKALLINCCVFVLLLMSAMGQDLGDSTSTYVSTKLHKTHVSRGGFLMFSKGVNSYQQMGNVTSPTRVSYWFNSETAYHYDPIPYVGMYIGGSIKNVGFITRRNDSTTKRRTYNLGMPLALKFGDFRKKVCVYGGIEPEIVLHYKEKLLTQNAKKKFGEWFSDRTDVFKFSYFAGVNVKNVNLKVSYYPTNFFKSGFTGNNPNLGRVESYGTYGANVLYVSLGFTSGFHARKNFSKFPSIPFKKDVKTEEKDEKEYSFLAH
jgi:hypothetical protein